MFLRCLLSVQSSKCFMQSAAWRKAREWSVRVLSQAVVLREVPEKVPEERDVNDTGTDGDSDAESDQ